MTWTKITQGRNGPTDEEAAYVAQSRIWNPHISGITSPIYSNPGYTPSNSPESISEEYSGSINEPQLDQKQQEKIERVAMLKEAAGRTANNPPSVYNL